MFPGIAGRRRRPDQCAEHHQVHRAGRPTEAAGCRGDGVEDKRRARGVPAGGDTGQHPVLPDHRDESGERHVPDLPQAVPADLRPIHGKVSRTHSQTFHL